MAPQRPRCLTRLPFASIARSSWIKETSSCRSCASHEASIGSQHCCFDPPIRVDRAKLCCGGLCFRFRGEHGEAGRTATSHPHEARAVPTLERVENLADDGHQAECGHLQIVRALARVGDQPLETPAEIWNLGSIRDLAGKRCRVESAI